MVHDFCCFSFSFSFLAASASASAFSYFLISSSTLENTIGFFTLMENCTFCWNGLWNIWQSINTFQTTWKHDCADNITTMMVFEKRWTVRTWSAGRILIWVFPFSLKRLIKLTIYGYQTERVDIISNPRPGERRQLDLLRGELRHVKSLAQHLGFNWFNVSLCLSCPPPTSVVQCCIK